MNLNAALLFGLIMITQGNYFDYSSLTNICFKCKDFLNSAQCNNSYSPTSSGQGHCVFINGACVDPPATTNTSINTAIIMNDFVHCNN